MDGFAGGVLLGREAEPPPLRVPVRIAWPEYCVAGVGERFVAVLSALVAERLAQRALLGPSGEPVRPLAVGKRRFEEGPAERSGEQPEAWAELPPGAELAEIIDEAELCELGVDELVRLAQSVERVVSRYEGRLVEVLAAMTRRPPYGVCAGADEHEHDRVRSAADEVSVAMWWTPKHADFRVRLAAELVDELPATVEALRSGRLDLYKARVVAEETRPLRDDPQLRERVEQAALDHAGRKTGPQLRSYLRRKVIAAAPESAEQRRRKARRDRRVERPLPEADGMASMCLVGPAEDLVALWTAVDAAARARCAAAAKTANGGTPDAGRSLEQLRFDVLADVGWSALQAGHLGCCAPGCAGEAQRLGTRHGKAASVGVTVPLSTLIGHDDHPAELDGYGPVTAQVARRIAAEGTWRRLVTDPASGALLDHGRTRYRPPADLTDHVIARDRTCRFPTCTWPAAASDLDHSTPAGQGGATSAANLGPLHRRHHNARTRHGWRFSQPEPGRFTWVSPAGLRYDVDPEVVGPIVDPPRRTGEPRAPDPPASDPVQVDPGREPPDDPPF